MDNGIIIREASPDDAEKLIGFFRLIGGESDNLSFGAEGIDITPEQERAFIERIASDRHSAFFVAVKDGEIVGDVSLSGFPRRMSHRAELSVVVAKREWHKGIGSLLMQKAILYATENDIELISLDVRHDNENAIKLYEKYGFVKVGTFPAFMRINGIDCDADTMVLDLR